ncbi:hypothetical protein GCM10015535_49030 [Streptomyces gelaticus]|uniref:HTH merR-type domain-containing protein n=1 Tax=Streptomyces gelaticus TaxID=285446 RepID=A0ABQ2W703_9ACTN|nr:MerR family transcriptional regulator [Streptomyces gelaticus]GGV91235.1 hypothetical protein GCM10015535_49030 [Streptomyces gelaticus]
MEEPWSTPWEVAGFAGVTVRTLHHYDGIGLLSPSGRSRSGHRRCDDGDLDRLQQILFYRELGFPLDEIAVLLDEVGAAPAAGEPATGERAMEPAEAHRRHIGKWFYECSAEMHRGLGEMYVSDERFRAYCDSMRPGPAEHLRDAIEANARRLA